MSFLGLQVPYGLDLVGVIIILVVLFYCLDDKG